MSTPDEAAVVCIRVPRVTTAALRPDAVVVHGLFRRRTVAWRDVADVRLEAWGVVLVRTDGRRVSLGYPSPGLLPPFGLRRLRADHARIREWWLAHRG